MTAEQIFQLKLAATDMAIRANATDVVAKAAEIYEYITAEARAAQEAKEATKVVALTKPSILEISDQLR